MKKDEQIKTQQSKDTTMWPKTEEKKTEKETKKAKKNDAKREIRIYSI